MKSLLLFDQTEKAESASSPPPDTRSPRVVRRPLWSPLVVGDAIAALQAVEAGSADLVITDPPYESLEKHRRVGTTTRLKHSKASSNDWFEIFPNARFDQLFREVYRVPKNNRHFYLFCDAETMLVA